MRSLVFWLACSFSQGCFLGRLCVVPIVWRICIITVGPNGDNGDKCPQRRQVSPIASNIMTSGPQDMQPLAGALGDWWQRPRV